MPVYFDPKDDLLKSPVKKVTLKTLIDELTQPDSAKKDKVKVLFSDSLEELNEVRNQKVERK